MYFNFYIYKMFVFFKADKTQKLRFIQNKKIVIYCCLSNTLKNKT